MGNAGAPGDTVNANIPAVIAIWKTVYMWIGRYDGRLEESSDGDECSSGGNGGSSDCGVRR